MSAPAIEQAVMIVLRAAQEAAVEKMMSISGPVWLRGETGTGKTITSIEAVIREQTMMAYRGLRVLVVVPERMLMEKWCDEITLMGQSAYLLGGKRDVERLLAAPEDQWPTWIVVSYNALSFSAGVGLRAMLGSFSHIIFDESQKAKSPGAKRVKKWKRYVKDNYIKLYERLKEAGALADWPRCRTLMLSATPLIHNAIDLITQYGVAAIQKELDGIVRYERKAITPEVVVDIPVGWDDDAVASGKVAEVLGRRRAELLQKDVFPADLPPMIQETWGLTLGSEGELHDALMAQAVKAPDPDDPSKRGDSDDLVEQWSDVLDMAIAGQTHNAEWWDSVAVLSESLREERGLKCTPRTMPLMIWGLFLRAEGMQLVPAVCARVKELGRPAVVFANHKGPLYRLKECLEPEGVRVGMYTGAQTPAQARAAKAALREGALDVLLATYQKGGVGVEFTPTPVVILAQRSPSPADMEQAKARIYRLNSVGQTWAYSCIGMLDGKVTRLEKSLSSIIDRKRAEAAIAGLAGTLG